LPFNPNKKQGVARRGERERLRERERERERREREERERGERERRERARAMQLNCHTSCGNEAASLNIDKACFAIANGTFIAKDN
jgi:hypothetical protein